MTAQCDVYDQLQHIHTHTYIHKCAHFNPYMQPVIYRPNYASLPFSNKQEQHVGISLVMEVATMTTAATTIFITWDWLQVWVRKILGLIHKAISVVRQWPIGCERITYFILLNSSEMDMIFFFFNNSFSGLTFIPRLRTPFTVKLLARQLRN